MPVSYTPPEKVRKWKPPPRSENPPWKMPQESSSGGVPEFARLQLKKAKPVGRPEKKTNVPSALVGLSPVKKPKESVEPEKPKSPIEEAISRLKSAGPSSRNVGDRTARRMASLARLKAPKGELSETDKENLINKSREWLGNNEPKAVDDDAVEALCKVAGMQVPARPIVPDERKNVWQQVRDNLRSTKPITIDLDQDDCERLGKLISKPLKASLSNAARDDLGSATKKWIADKDPSEADLSDGDIVALGKLAGVRAPRVPYSAGDKLGHIRDALSRLRKPEIKLCNLDQPALQNLAKLVGYDVPGSEIEQETKEEIFERLKKWSRDAPSAPEEIDTPVAQSLCDATGVVMSRNGAGKKISAVNPLRPALVRGDSFDDTAVEQEKKRGGRRNDESVADSSAISISPCRPKVIRGDSFDDSEPKTIKRKATTVRIAKNESPDFSGIRLKKTPRNRRLNHGQLDAVCKLAGLRAPAPNAPSEEKQGILDNAINNLRSSRNDQPLLSPEVLEKLAKFVGVPKPDSPISVEQKEEACDRAKSCIVNTTLDGANLDDGVVDSICALAGLRAPSRTIPKPRKESAIQEALERLQSSAKMPPAGQLDPATVSSIARHLDLCPPSIGNDLESYDSVREKLKENLLGGQIAENVDDETVDAICDCVGLVPPKRKVPIAWKSKVVEAATSRLRSGNSPPQPSSLDDDTIKILEGLSDVRAPCFDGQLSSRESKGALEAVAAWLDKSDIDDDTMSDDDVSLLCSAAGLRPPTRTIRDSDKKEAITEARDRVCDGKTVAGDNFTTTTLENLAGLVPDYEHQRVEYLSPCQKAALSSKASNWLELNRPDPKQVSDAAVDAMCTLSGIRPPEKKMLPEEKDDALHEAISRLRKKVDALTDLDGQTLSELVKMTGNVFPSKIGKFEPSQKAQLVKSVKNWIGSNDVNRQEMDSDTVDAVCRLANLGPVPRRYSAIEKQNLLKDTRARLERGIQAPKECIDEETIENLAQLADLTLCEEDGNNPSNFLSRVRDFILRKDLDQINVDDDNVRCLSALAGSRLPRGEQLDSQREAFLNEAFSRLKTVESRDTCIDDTSASKLATLSGCILPSTAQNERQLDTASRVKDWLLDDDVDGELIDDEDIEAICEVAGLCPPQKTLSKETKETALGDAIKCLGNLSLLSKDENIGDDDSAELASFLGVEVPVSASARSKVLRDAKRKLLDPDFSFSSVSDRMADTICNIAGLQTPLRRIPEDCKDDILQDAFSRLCNSHGVKEAELSSTTIQRLAILPPSENPSEFESATSDQTLAWLKSDTANYKEDDATVDAICGLAGLRSRHRYINPKDKRNAIHDALKRLKHNEEGCPSAETLSNETVAKLHSFVTKTPNSKLDYDPNVKRSTIENVRTWLDRNAVDKDSVDDDTVDALCDLAGLGPPLRSIPKDTRKKTVDQVLSRLDSGRRGKMSKMDCNTLSRVSGLPLDSTTLSSQIQQRLSTNPPPVASVDDEMLETIAKLSGVGLAGQIPSESLESTMKDAIHRLHENPATCNPNLGMGDAKNIVGLTGEDPSQLKNSRDVAERLQVAKEWLKKNQPSKRDCTPGRIRSLCNLTGLAKPRRRYPEPGKSELLADAIKKLRKVSQGAKPENLDDDTITRLGSITNEYVPSFPASPEEKRAIAAKAKEWLQNNDVRLPSETCDVSESQTEDSEDFMIREVAPVSHLATTPEYTSDSDQDSVLGSHGSCSDDDYCRRQKSIKSKGMPKGNSQGSGATASSESDSNDDDSSSSDHYQRRQKKVRNRGNTTGTPQKTGDSDANADTSGEGYRGRRSVGNQGVGRSSDSNSPDGDDDNYRRQQKSVGNKGSSTDYSLPKATTDSNSFGAGYRGNNSIGSKGESRGDSPVDSDSDDDSNDNYRRNRRSIGNKGYSRDVSGRAKQKTSSILDFGESISDNLVFEDEDAGSDNDTFLRNRKFGGGAWSSSNPPKKESESSSRRSKKSKASKGENSKKTKKTTNSGDRRREKTTESKVNDRGSSTSPRRSKKVSTDSKSRGLESLPEEASGRDSSSSNHPTSPRSPIRTQKPSGSSSQSTSPRSSTRTTQKIPAAPTSSPSKSPTRSCRGTTPKSPRKYESAAVARSEVIIAEKDATRRANEDNEKYLNDRRYRCYMWFSRMGCPNKKEMKRRVANLPAANNDITLEDVELLPWMPGGFCLNVKEMNKLFVNPERLE